MLFFETLPTFTDYLLIGNFNIYQNLQELKNKINPVPFGCAGRLLIAVTVFYGNNGYFVVDCKINLSNTVFLIISTFILIN